MNQATQLNFSTIRQYRIRALILLLIKLIFIALFLAGCLVFVFDYLANLPRERKTRHLNYFDRVKYGATLAGNMIYSAFTAPEDSPRNTKLPVVQLFVPGDALDRLNSSLPESGKVFQEGLIKLDGKTQEVKVRYRGDSINHWGFPEKSWRVRFKGEKTYKGIRSLNLYLPRTTAQISDFLGYWIGEQMQLATPEAYPIHLRLNGKFSGMRMFLEQVDRNFITRRDLQKGKIYNGDITTSELYGRVKRKHLFQSTASWEVDAAGYQNPLEAQDKSEMDYLINLLQRAKSDPNLLVTELPKILDVEQVLKYMALLGIVGSTHVDNTHNQKFYYNAEKKLFTPIVWDAAAYFWGNLRAVDIDSNDLFLLLLTVPEYREKKNLYIWNAIHGALSTEKIQAKITELADAIRNEVEANPFKLEAEHRAVQFVSNDQWRSGVSALLALVAERNDTLKKILSANAASYKAVSKDNEMLLDLVIESHANFILKEISVNIPNFSANKKCTLFGQSPSSIAATIASDQKTAKFELADVLYSKRAFVREKGVKKFLPGVYQYRIQCENASLAGAEVQAVSGENSITKAKFFARKAK